MTKRSENGRRAEELVADTLARAGWTVLSRNVRVAKDEIDIVAVDPGPPGALVCVEVRSRSGPRYGTPEDGVDDRKVLRSHRAALALASAGVLPDGRHLPALPRRVDLVAVEWRGAGGQPVLRHLRDLAPARW